MTQPSENIIVLSPGEQIPPGTDEYLKIYLAGSIDLAEAQKFDWQSIFINGLVELTDPTKGIIMYKNQKFLIINPKMPISNPELSATNPEFVNKFSWSIDMMNQADAIFCNFLKKSKAILPLYEQGLASTSQKLVVRCPEEYQYYPIVKLVCEKLSIPLLPGKVSSVLSVIQSMYSFVPKFQELQKLRLPE